MSATRTQPRLYRCEACQRELVIYADASEVRCGNVDEHERRQLVTMTKASAP